jgi:hypothetical protein
MDSPNGVWRKTLSQEQARYAAINLLNLDFWPSWNSTAKRILSVDHGDLVESQRFDLHRIERQQLIEEMWEVKNIRRGDEPEFLEIRFEWLGQLSNGKSSGNAIKSLIVEVTVLCQDQGGIEIAAWWQIKKWSRLIKGKINNSAREISKQWLNDLSQNGIFEIKNTLEKTVKSE